MIEYKITKIVQKNVEFFELFLEKIKENQKQTEKIEVQAQVLATLGILKPMVISPEQYQILNEKRQYYSAYGKAINFLSYRKRSVEEMRKYLIEKDEFSEKNIYEVIQKLVDQNYLNDKDFMQSYINTALKSTLKGPKKIREELAEYGCDNDSITQIIEQSFSFESESDRLVQVFQKIKRKKYLSVQELLQKYETRAISLGYNYDAIQFVKKESNTNDVVIDDKKINRILEKAYAKAQKKEESLPRIQQQLKQKLVSKSISYEDANKWVTIFLEEQLDEN